MGATSKPRGVLSLSLFSAPRSPYLYLSKTQLQWCSAPEALDGAKLLALLACDCVQPKRDYRGIPPTMWYIFVELYGKVEY